MLIKDRGIILKQINTGEADKIVTILTQHNGKLKAVMKGCRKPKSRFVGIAEQFVVSELVLFKGSGDLFRVSQGEIKESYYNLRSDLLKLSYASYFAELAEIVAEEEVQSEKLFFDLVWALHFLNTGKAGLGLTSLTYLLKLMELSGYKPMLLHCANCHEEVRDSEVFSVSLGGMLCKGCSWTEKKPMKLSVPARLNMLQLLALNMPSLAEQAVGDAEFRASPRVAWSKSHVGKWHCFHVHSNARKPGCLGGAAKG